MKIRISAGEYLYSHEVPIDQIDAYIDLLNTYQSIDEDGGIYSEPIISIDVFLNALEISYAKSE